jgi:hypothetical protein
MTALVMVKAKLAMFHVEHRRFASLKASDGIDNLWVIHCTGGQFGSELRQKRQMFHVEHLDGTLDKSFIINKNVSI